MYQYSIAIGENNKDTFGIKNLELCDGYFGKPLALMSPAEVEDARNYLIKSFCKVVLYTVSMPVSQYDSYVQFFRNAHLIGAENVKLAFDAIDGADNAQILQVIKIADAFGIKVLFEIEASASEKFGFEQYKALRSDATGLIFNPNEFVKLHQNPFLTVLYKSKLKDDIVFLRVCDSLYDSNIPMLPEKGNSEIKECASNLLSRSFKGYFSFTKYGDDIAVGDVMDAFVNALCNM